MKKIKFAGIGKTLSVLVIALMIFGISSPAAVFATEETSFSYEASGVNRAADKTDLDAAIATAPTHKDYYTKRDRYNGRKTSEKGFWKEYIAALQEAQAVSSDDGAEQSSVDRALENLKASIANLIPKTEVNATLLYENIKYISNLSGENYSPESWASASAALADAQNALKPAEAMLRSLYYNEGDEIPEGKSIGDATPVNVSGYQPEVDAEVQALRKALADVMKILDRLADEDSISRAKDAVRYTEILANDLFDPEKLSSDGFDAESLKSYETVRAEVLDYIAANRPPVQGSGVGYKVTQNYIKNHTKLYEACYYGLKSQKDITVSLSVVDNYAFFKGEPAITDVTEQTLTLSVSNSTLNDALLQTTGMNASQLDNAARSNRQPYGAVGIYINGFFLQSTVGHIYKQNAVTPNYYSIGDMQLHDGDTVLVELFSFPTYTNLSGSTVEHTLEEIGTSNIRYGSITDGEGAQITSATVEAGQPLTLGASSSEALLLHYPGRKEPAAGASVYVSDCFTSEEEARRQGSYANETAVTDGDGAFDAKFYAEGYYLLNIFDKTSKFTALKNFVPIIVHVTESHDPSAVKQELKQSLEELYNEYPQEFYDGDDWKTVKESYEEAVRDIDEAGTLGEASSLHQKAADKIRSIQEGTAKAHNDTLSAIRAVLSVLPDDASLLGSDKALLLEGVTISHAGHIPGLIERYESLSPYVKDSLTHAEQKKCEDLKAAHDAGLKDLGKKNIRLDISAETPEDEAAIREMINYLRKTKSENVIDSYGLYEFNAEPYELSDRSPWVVSQKTGESTVMSSSSALLNTREAYPGMTVAMVINPGYSAYALMDLEGVDGEPKSVEGDNWSISAGSLLRDSQYTGFYYDISGSPLIKIRGREYTLKDIKVSGTDEVSYTHARLCTKVKADGTFLGRNIDFPDSLLYFDMPYNDVSVEMVWAPADGTADEIAQARAAAQAANTISI